jgi:tetratricopeptide (TPR) repeat protein
VASKGNRGLIATGIAAGVLLVATLTVLVGISRGASVLPGSPGSGLAEMADSVFAAEYGRVDGISLEPVLSVAELRLLQTRRLPLAVLLSPVAALRKTGIRLAELGSPSAHALRPRAELLRLRLRAGRIHDAAFEAGVLGIRFRELGERNNSVNNLSLSYGLYRLCGNNPGAAVALEQLATTWQAEQDYPQSDTALRQALVLHRRLEDRVAEVRVLVNLGCNRQFAGQTDSAAACYVAAIELARAHGLAEEDALRNLRVLLDNVGPEELFRLCAPRLGDARASELLALLIVPGEPARG